jgi:hypothetical protein
MSDLNHQLTALLDREAIRELPKVYCDRVWQDDAQAVSELFLPDGRFSAILNDRRIDILGRDKIEAFMREGLSDSPRPFIHNHVITLTGAKTATGRAYLDLRSGKHNFEWLGVGYYEDEYEKDDGRWYFASRNFHALRIDDWPGDIDKL